MTRYTPNQPFDGSTSALTLSTVARAPHPLTLHVQSTLSTGGEEIQYPAMSIAADWQAKQMATGEHMSRK